jgi:hypothetical protein
MAVGSITKDKIDRAVGRGRKRSPNRHAGDNGNGKAELGQLKPLRPGQRHRGRKARKVKVVTSFTEAPEVENRADKIIGADVWRLRSLAQEKILYLYSSAERISGCMDGIVRAGRYPRIFRYKPALKYEFLILVAKPRWDRATDEDKTRIAYHALRHCGLDVNGRQRTEPHDHEGFYSEVEFFGVRSPEVRKITEQLELFEPLHKRGKED